LTRYLERPIQVMRMHSHLNPRSIKPMPNCSPKFGRPTGKKLNWQRKGKLYSLKLTSDANIK
jgi:hypothetical protein